MKENMYSEVSLVYRKAFEKNPRISQHFTFTDTPFGDKFVGHGRIQILVLVIVSLAFFTELCYLSQSAIICEISCMLLSRTLALEARRQGLVINSYVSINGHSLKECWNTYKLPNKSQITQLILQNG